MIYASGDGALRCDVSRSDVTEYSCMNRHHREPTGHLCMETIGKVLSASMRLDLWNAEARGEIRTSAGSIRWRAFVHTERMLFVFDAETVGDESGYRWVWHEDHVDWHAIFPNRQRVPYAPVESRLEDRDGFHLWSRPFLEGGNQAVAWTETAADRARWLYLSPSRERLRPSAGETAAATIRASMEAGMDDIERSHREGWHAFYEKSFLSVPDTRLEGFYWIQMYKLGCATRADRPAIDVLGPWWMLQAWPAIWWNLNIQLSYSPVYAANQLDLGESLCRMLDAGLPNLIRNVPAHCREGSAAVGRVSSYDGDCSGTGGVPESGKELCNLLFTCYYVWLQYRYGMDDVLLRRTLYPLLCRAVNFYRHLLRTGSDGRYHLPLAVSPEYPTPAEDTNADLSLLRWGCETLIDLSVRLDVDDNLRTEWRDILDNLAEHPAGAAGFMIGRGVPYSKSHRHHSHLLMIYPLHLYQWTDPRRRDVIERSFDHWMELKGGHAGYSYCLAASFCTLMGRADEALAYLQTFLDRYPTPNTMYLEGAPRSSGLEDGALIETPLAAATALQEMLLQSWGGVIRVFPALPAHWSDVTIDLMRCEGAFLVSAVRQTGQTQFVRIESLAGEPCRLRTDMAGPLRVLADRAVMMETDAEGTITIDLRAGESAVLCPVAASCDFAVAAAAPDARDLNYYGSPKRRPVAARPDGSIHLLSEQARLTGSVRHVRGGRRNDLSGWSGPEDRAEWDLTSGASGVYEVRVLCRCAGKGDGSFRVAHGKSVLRGVLPPDEGTLWEPYIEVNLGTMHLDASQQETFFLISDSADRHSIGIYKVILLPQCGEKE